MEEPMMDFCAVCGEKKSKLCQGCMSISYCCEEHQEEHWNAHKDSCRNFRSEINAERVRCLVSARKLRPGQVVFSEEPLVALPTPFHAPVCLGCSEHVSGSIRCDACGWPVCDRSCSLIENHRPECSIFSRKNCSGISTKDLPYSHVQLFRCLGLKTTMPAAWDVLTGFDNCTNVYFSPEEYREETKFLLLTVRRFVDVEEHSDKSVLQLSRIVRRSSFDRVLCKFNNMWKPCSMRLSFIYRFASLLDHSCTPNCFFDVRADGSITVTTLAEISKSATLCITYADPFICTLERNLGLVTDRLMQCLCRRCLDPTELATYINSFVCDFCRTGFVSPYEDPVFGSSAWKCDSCGRAVPARTIVSKIDILKPVIAQLDQGTVNEIMSFIRLAMRFLHRNHAVLMYAERLVCRAFLDKFRNRGLLNEERKHFCMLYRHLLAVNEKLNPGRCSNFVFTQSNP